MTRSKKMHCDTCSTTDPIHGICHPTWVPTRVDYAARGWQLNHWEPELVMALDAPAWECANCHAQKPRQVRNSKVTQLIDSGAGLDAIIDQMIADREPKAKCKHTWERRAAGSRVVYARGQCKRETRHASGYCSAHRPTN
tara:strand:- start:3521 stop:3940 length:420 start_codon:yes stop_codon:yes gene_type:complete